MKPAKELKLPDDILFKIRRHLYGIPEAGLHWFKTNHSSHREELNMKTSGNNLCSLYPKDAPSLDRNLKPAGITCLQTDESLFFANTQFKNLE